MLGVYPFWGVFGSMIIFFIWIAWFMLLFRVIGNALRWSDLSGLGKTGWIIFVIILPFLGVFIYLITQNDGMTAVEYAGGPACRSSQARRGISSRSQEVAARRPRSIRPSSCSTAGRSRRRSSRRSSRRHSVDPPPPRACHSPDRLSRSMSSWRWGAGAATSPSTPGRL